MDKNVLKIIGVVGIVLGSVALFLAGIAETTVGAIVAGVFVLAGVIVEIFLPTKKKE